MRSNRYKVPQKQWKKWSGAQRYVFNDVFSSMLHNQDLYMHANAPRLPRAQWRVTAWNAAYIAAGAVRAAA